MTDKPIKIGGQALIEGVMMKGVDSYSVAVRKPDGDIDVTVKELPPAKFSKVPFVRGIVNFFGSLSVGYECIMRSAELSMGQRIEEDALDRFMKKIFGDKRDKIMSVVAGALGAVLALALFMVLPTAATGLIDKIFPLKGFKAVVEAAVKLGIFMLYLWAVSNLKEMSRLFAYHGAEHKTIYCYEKGLPLTVENARGCSRFHPRCGTSFMFLVLAVSIAVFSFIPWTSTLGRALTKLAFLPVAVSLAYEVQRFSAMHEGVLSDILSMPGLAFQRLTTKEPDDDMLEVAIASVNAVLPQTKVIPRKKEQRPEITEDINALSARQVREEYKDIYEKTDSISLRDMRGYGFKIISVNPQSDRGFETGQLAEFILGEKSIDLGSDYIVSGDKFREFLDCCFKRRRGYPLQYIIGQWSFFDIDLKVGEGVLIPRQDTERVCEKALEILAGIPQPNVLDLCSGTGAIALAIEKYCPAATVVAVEKYDEAYDYLVKNIRGTGNLVLPIKGDVFKMDYVIDDESFDMIICNPPYINPRDKPSLRKELSYEPESALFAGEDGLRFYKFISKYYRHCLKEGGYMIFEHGYDQRESVENILLNEKYIIHSRITDYRGNPRGIVAVKDEGEKSKIL